MFEGLISRVLNWGLPSLFQDIDSKQLQLEFVKGHVHIQHVKLNAEEINTLLTQRVHLPVRVVSGSVESCEVVISWRTLFSDPLIVKVNGVHLALTCPSREQGFTLNEEEQVKEAIAEKLAALQQLEESKMLELETKTPEVPTTSVRLATLLAGVQVDVNNIHVSFHSSTSTLTAGLVLRDARITTCDAQGHDKGILGGSIASKKITVTDLCIYANTSVDTAIPATAVAAVAATKSPLAQPTSIDSILSNDSLETIVEPMSFGGQVTFSTKISDLSNLQLKMDGGCDKNIKLNLSLTQYAELLSHVMLFQYHLTNIEHQYDAVQNNIFRHATLAERDTYIATYKSSHLDLTSWMSSPQDIAVLDREICYTDLAELRVTALLAMAHVHRHHNTWYDYLKSWVKDTGCEFVDAVQDVVEKNQKMLEQTNIQGESVVTAFDIASSSPTPLFVTCSLSFPGVVMRVSCTSHPRYRDKDGLIGVDVEGIGACVAIQGSSHQVTSEIRVDDVQVRDLYGSGEDPTPHMIMAKHTTSEQKMDALLQMKMQYKDSPPPPVGSTCDISFHDIHFHIRSGLILLAKQIMSLTSSMTQDHKQDKCKDNEEVKIDETLLTPLLPSPITPILSALFPITANLVINPYLHLQNIILSCACHVRGYVQDMDLSQVDATANVKQVKCISSSSPNPILNPVNMSVRLNLPSDSAGGSSPALTYQMSPVDMSVTNTTYERIRAIVNEMNIEFPDSIKQRMKTEKIEKTEAVELHEIKRSSTIPAPVPIPIQAAQTRLFEGEHKHSPVQLAGAGIGRPIQDVRHGTERRGFCASCWAYIRSLCGVSGSGSNETEQGYTPSSGPVSISSRARL